MQNDERVKRRRGSDSRRLATMAGFSLVEVAVALTIVVIITAIAIPTARGFREEREARKPLGQLAALVQDMRQHARDEGRAYQIVFEPTGFHGLPFKHSLHDLSEFRDHLQELAEGSKSREIERARSIRQDYRAQSRVQ